ncbi:MAG: LPS export ABC transporter protein LptC [Flavobacteriales bacterium]|jgi:LPS export ABC transporter protein LptC
MISSKKFQLSITIISVVMLFSCRNDLEEVQLMVSENMPVQTTYDAVYTYSDSARITSVINTVQLDRYEFEDSSYAIFPSGLSIEFKGGNGQANSTLVAEYGVWKQTQGTMEVQKKVVFTNDKGEKLETEKLIWYQDSAKIYTDEFVKITQEGAVIYGHGMEAAEDFSWYRLSKISGEFDIDDEEFE